MVKLGWMQDAHNRADPNSTNPGAQQRMVEDYDWLVSDGVDDMYFTGDMVDHDENGGNDIPHVSADAYDNLWDLVDQTTDPDLVRAYIPGNHDVPLQPFLQSDPRCVLRKRIDYDSDGVSVFLINTQANGWTTGGAGASDQAGPATEFPRMAYADILWLDEQLDDAGSNAKLVLPHAAPYGAALGAGAGLENGAIPDSDSHTYNIIQNYQKAHNVLNSYSKVVVPISHLYQFSIETANTVGSVDYIVKDHYYRVGQDQVYTFGRIDITDTSVTVDTIEHSDKSVNTLLDKTF